MPKVSVIIPTFNAEKHIEETLDSILSQSDCDFEVLVIDDGSSDSTVRLVTSIADSRVRLHTNVINHGLPGTMNLAMSLAKGEYIARLDHDDLALPQRLAAQASFLDDNRDITVVGTQIQHFGMDDTMSDFPLDDARIKARFLGGAAYLANPSAMWRADFVRSNRIAYDANLYVVDDLGFWFDCMLYGAKFANLPDVLLRYRIHAAMTSLRLDANRLFRSKCRLYERLLPMYFPRLDGPSCASLLDLYHVGWGTHEITALHEQHRAAGLALREVGTAFGQNPMEVKNQLLGLLNGKRQALLEVGKLSAADTAELDQSFYAGLDEQKHRVTVAGTGVGTHLESEPAPLSSTRIYQCFSEAPALCVKHDSYFQVYEALFAKYVGKPVTLVEVGVFSGGSLHMWRRYLGPQARIIGVDLNPAARKWEKNGFEIFIGDQSSSLFWEDFYKRVGSIDVLIDDGGHMNHQQIVTADRAFSHLNDGGMLIVEDVHTSYMPGFNSEPRHSFVEFGKHVADAVNARFPGIKTGATCYKDRVWNVSFFESIVAFHVDRRRCFNSSWHSNVGQGGVTEDYRLSGLGFDSIPDIASYFK
ncbi:glycosyltransferase [Paraburkholderia sp. UYCP14C]|uniref:glycosyltransferase n=1 Tax=Paraburkholderia sp. UYCP14C TaxID=2511130 RepID=UPI00101FE77D|nr:glycosyltransferase [Paraburkholderia sp. UYCP14C]RZF30207.1 glycosyltransferase [Paraburkholderia sp. UYCP14C]